MSKLKVTHLENKSRHMAGGSPHLISPGETYEIAGTEVSKDRIGDLIHIVFIGGTSYSAIVRATRRTDRVIEFTAPADLPSISQEFVSVGAVTKYADSHFIFTTNEG